MDTLYKRGGTHKFPELLKNFI